MKLEPGTKLQPQHRFIPIERQQIDEEKRTVELSFSSEEPVERWWGTEILVHEKGSAKLTRLNARASLLFNHDRNDVVGVVEKAWVDTKEKKGYATVRFARSLRGEEIFGMVRDGILANVSSAYRILTVEEKPKEEVFRVTEWEPLEISMVTIPADITVGVGRLENQEYEVRIIPDGTHQPALDAERRRTMPEEKGTTPASESAEEKGKKQEIEVRSAAEEAIEVTRRKNEQLSAAEMEKRRKEAIGNLCKANKLDQRYAEMWIGQGVAIEDVADDIVRILEERGKTNPQPASRLGLTARETERFSLCRAILATASKNWTNAPFELECSREVEKKLGKVPEDTKFYVPYEVQQRSVVEIPERLKRDLTVGTAGAGGYLVSTDNVGFVEMLRNRSVAFRMGARRLSGLQGSVTIPRQSAAATAYWLSTEATDITESQQTFVQISLSPKTVGAYTEISRQLLLQSSPGAEGIVTDDLAAVAALAVDLSALEGSGSAGQPTGIANTSGIGSVTGTSLAAAGILEFMSDVAGNNITPIRPGYVTTPAVAALLMVRPELPTTGTTRLWTGSMWDGALFGIPAMSSNQPTAATMIFGDWQELVIAEWGVLEVEVNPYANFKAGIIGVRGIYTADIGVRRPVAFSRSTSIT